MMKAIKKREIAITEFMSNSGVEPLIGRTQVHDLEELRKFLCNTINDDRLNHVVVDLTVEKLMNYLLRGLDP